MTITDHVKITEDELNALIKLATGDRHLPLVFGPGWVGIDIGTLESKWAITVLSDIRKG